MSDTRERKEVERERGRERQKVRTHDEELQHLYFLLIHLTLTCPRFYSELSLSRGFKFLLLIKFSYFFIKERGWHPAQITRSPVVIIIICDVSDWTASANVWESGGFTVDSNIKVSDMFVILSLVRLRVMSGDRGLQPRVSSPNTRWKGEQADESSLKCSQGWCCFHRCLQQQQQNIFP